MEVHGQLSYEINNGGGVALDDLRLWSRLYRERRFFKRIQIDQRNQRWQTNNNNAF